MYEDHRGLHDQSYFRQLERDYPDWRDHLPSQQAPTSPHPWMTKTDFEAFRRFVTEIQRGERLVPSLTLAVRTWFMRRESSRLRVQRISSKPDQYRYRSYYVSFGEDETKDLYGHVCTTVAGLMLLPIHVTRVSRTQMRRLVEVKAKTSGVGRPRSVQRNDPVLPELWFLDGAEVPIEAIIPLVTTPSRVTGWLKRHNLPITRTWPEAGLPRVTPLTNFEEMLIYTNSNGKLIFETSDTIREQQRQAAAEAKAEQSDRQFLPPELLDILRPDGGHIGEHRPARSKKRRRTSGPTPASQPTKADAGVSPPFTEPLSQSMPKLTPHA